jgi:IMP dehydrogenase
MTDYYRKKVHYKEIIATFDDILIQPGFTNFEPNEVDISTHTVTEEGMAIKMALLGGLGVLHRNCSYERQLEMVRIVKRARSFVIDDVATITQNEPIATAKYMMENYNISGIVVVNEDKKVCGIFTKRDIPFSDNDIKNGKIKNYMTKDVISIEPGASRQKALKILFESEGHLICALALSPKYPESTQAQDLLKEIDKYVDIFFIDVADFYKTADINGTKKLMDLLESDFVLGNIGTYGAAEHIITKCDFNEDKFIGLKVGMGSGSICTTSIQTGVGAPTLFATAQVADAIADYNSKISLIADGGFKNPGDLPKSLTAGADLIMSGHFFAGSTESPGYVDTIQGRKVKVYRGMGSKEARTAGYVSDRYTESSRMLPEGVSDYVPFVGDIDGVLLSLKEGLLNGMIYAGAKRITEMKKAKIGVVSYVGQRESRPHDLLSRY